MKKVFLSAVLISLAGAPLPCFGSGYEFEGIGTREVSRAGAAVADSDDWSAVYWNPANIVRATAKSGTEIGLEAIYGIAREKDSNSLSSSLAGPIFQKDQLDSRSVLGALGVISPLGDKAAVGFGVYTPLLQGVDFHDKSDSMGTVLDYKGSAMVLTSNISLSAQITPSFSAGAGLNLLYGRIHSETNLTALVVPNPFLIPPTLTANVNGKLDGSGLGTEGVFGLTWDPHPALSLAATYRTGSDIPVKGDASADSSSILGSQHESSRFKFSLRQPPTLDTGLACRPGNRWTLSFDVHQTYWHRFSNETTYDTPGALLTDRPNTFTWRDTWKLRFGASWQAAQNTTLLAGYSYDRFALDSGSVDFANVVDPSMHRFSAGVAQRWGKRFETILGAIGGFGNRSENGLRYGLSGFQLMAESRLTFGG